MTEPARRMRVGVPSFVHQALLEGFPPEVDVVLVDPDGTEPVEVEFLLAPWSQKHVNGVLPRLRGAKVVQSFGAGIEGLLPLMPAGATLCNARNLHNVPTAEWAVTAILASLKFLPFYAGLQREGRWISAAAADENYAGIYGEADPGALPILCEELAGKTVLIVGYGAIGKAIEERLVAFEPKIVRVARSAKEGVSSVADLPELLPHADVVVLITPLTPETRHLIDAAAIARMKRGALLVNAARGGVVDTDALVAALEERRIRAALDVTDPSRCRRASAMARARAANHPACRWVEPGVPEASGRLRAGAGRTVPQRRAVAQRHHQRLLTKP